jgi:hypothetical protein
MVSLLVSRKGSDESLKKRAEPTNTILPEGSRAPGDIPEVLRTQVAWFLQIWVDLIKDDSPR